MDNIRIRALFRMNEAEKKELRKRYPVPEPPAPVNAAPVRPANPTIPSAPVQPVQPTPARPAQPVQPTPARPAQPLQPTQAKPMEVKKPSPVYPPVGQNGYMPPQLNPAHSAQKKPAKKKSVGLIIGIVALLVLLPIFIIGIIIMIIAIGNGMGHGGGSSSGIRSSSGTRNYSSYSTSSNSSSFSSSASSSISSQESYNIPPNGNGDVLYAEGYCGSNSKFYIWDDGGLQVYGSGPITGFTLTDSLEPIASDEMITYAIIGDEITTINAGVFSGMPNLGGVLIPESVTYISSSAFEGSDKVVIYCYPGSFAERYAKGYNISYKIMDNSAVG